jgi:hypothetical protein
MASFEFLAIILTGLGLTVSILYYTSVLQNANKTRQIQLFMELNSRFDNPLLMRALIKSRDYEGISFDEWFEKYGPDGDREVYIDWVCLQNALQGIGLLVKSNQVKAETVEELMGSIIVLNWMRSGPIIMEMRERLGRRGAWSEVEYLYEELMKIQTKESD